MEKTTSGNRREKAPHARRGQGGDTENVSAYPAAAAARKAPQIQDTDRGFGTMPIALLIMAASLSGKVLA